MSAEETPVEVADVAAEEAAAPAEEKAPAAAEEAAAAPAEEEAAAAEEEAAAAPAAEEAAAAAPAPEEAAAAAAPAEEATASVAAAKKEDASAPAATKVEPVAPGDASYRALPAVFAKSDGAKNEYYQRGIDYMASTLSPPAGAPQLCGVMPATNPYRTTPGESWKQGIVIPTENSFGPSTWRNIRYQEGLRTTPVDGCATPVELFSTACTKYAARRALGWRTVNGVHDGRYGGRAHAKWKFSDYEWMTYAELKAAVDTFARKLASIGLVKGDIVSLFAETSKEWQIACQACFKLGITVATVYATLGPEGLKHGLVQTESKAIIFHSQLAKIVEAVLDDCDALLYAICIVDPTAEGYAKSSPAPTTCSKPMDVAAAKALLVAKKATLNVVDYDAAAWVDGDVPAATFPKVAPEDLAVIMYTSGSTGTPKGVEITMANFCAAVASGSDAIGTLIADETYIAYLPLAHIFEMMVEMFMLVNGARIGYGTTKTLSNSSAATWSAECGGTSSGDAPTLSPTMMCAVPVSVLLFTVTCYAILAHSLTRSP